MKVLVLPTGYLTLFPTIVAGYNISSRYPSKTAVKVLSLGTFLETKVRNSLPFTLFLAGIMITGFDKCNSNFLVTREWTFLKPVKFCVDI